MENQEFQVVVEELKRLSGTLATLADGQQRIVERLERVETRLENVEKGQVELQARLGKVETRLENVEKSQLRLENRIEGEVIEKLRALFDAREVSLDYFASLKNGQARLEENMELLLHHTGQQEFKLREHERELRLLRLENKHG